ncbi:RNA-binding component of cleavage and polyadenylation factor [Exophiala xenobiotica]
MASVATDSTPGAVEAIAKTNLNASPYPSYNFSFTPFLRSNGIAALAATVPVCPDYAATGHCPRGRRCADRHPTPSQQPHQHHYGRQNDNYVCKHWLKGLCKKGDACDYLHEYNLRKMSECQFYNQNGYCQNGDECLYVHVKEGSKLPLCEDYNKGFCEKGPRCGKRHNFSSSAKAFCSGISASRGLSPSPPRRNEDFETPVTQRLCVQAYGDVGLNGHAFDMEEELRLISPPKQWDVPEWVDGGSILQ